MLPHHRLEEVGFERQKSWLGFTSSLTKVHNINNSFSFSSDPTWRHNDFNQRGLLLSTMRTKSATCSCIQEQQTFHLDEKTPFLNNNILRTEPCTNSLPSTISSPPLISLTSLQESLLQRTADYGKDSSAFPLSDKQPWHIERMKQRNHRRRTVKCGEDDNNGGFLMVWNRSMPFPSNSSVTNTTTYLNTNNNNTNWHYIATTESSQQQQQHVTNTHTQIDNVDKVVTTNSICTPSLTVKTVQGLQSPVTMTTAFQKGRTLCSKSTSTTDNSSWTGSRTAYKEAGELLYQDPVSGAPSSFLHRLNEIAALEAETVRQERARKLKKKCKHDKESYSY